MKNVRIRRSPMLTALCVRNAEETFARLVWDGEEGHVRFDEDFNTADWVLKADALVDWIADLQTRYGEHVKS